MPKINFTKVEEALAEGLRKMSVSELDKMAEISQSLGRPELAKLAEAALIAAAQKALERKAILYVLRHGVELHKDEAFYKEFNLTFKEFSDLIEKGRGLTPDDWQKLELIKVKMLAFKEAKIAKNAELGNEEQVNKMIKEQKNARMNVSKTWLPLQ